MPINDDKFKEFTKANVDKSPENAGVYALFDGNECIYYGRAQGGSVTIRSRLQSHQRGDEGPCTKKATHYKREVTSYPISREKELLEAYEKSFGRLPRCNKKIG
jgi:hypothetical protein